MFMRNYVENEEDGHEMVSDMVAILRDNSLYPCQSTCSRWNRIAELYGHVRPCKKTGNKQPERLRGPDLVYLAMYRVAYPKATIAEVLAFLYRCNLGNVGWSFYSKSQISLAEKAIGLSRKKASTTAYQAYLPVNLRKRKQHLKK